MNIWAVAPLNKLFLKGFYTQFQFSKTRVVSGKFPLFMIGPFCTPHTICLNIVFLQDRINLAIVQLKELYRCETVKL